MPLKRLVVVAVRGSNKGKRYLRYFKTNTGYKLAIKKGGKIYEKEAAWVIKHEVKSEVMETARKRYEETFGD
jgi:hypothetical protein